MDNIVVLNIYSYDMMIFIFINLITGPRLQVSHSSYRFQRIILFWYFSVQRLGTKVIMVLDKLFITYCYETRKFNFILFRLKSKSSVIHCLARVNSSGVIIVIQEQVFCFIINVIQSKKEKKKENLNHFVAAQF